MPLCPLPGFKARLPIGKCNALGPTRVTISHCRRTTYTVVHVVKRADFPKYQGNHSDVVDSVHLTSRPTQLMGHCYPRPRPHSLPQSLTVSRSRAYESAYINVVECFKTLFRPSMTPLDSTRNRNPPNLNPYTCGGSKSQGFLIKVAPIVAKGRARR